MKVSRWTARAVVLLAVSLAAFSMAAVMQPFTPNAQAQSANMCDATNESNLAACITQYSTATSDMTIQVRSEILLTTLLPDINNTAANPPQLTIDGGGHLLNGDGAVATVLTQFDGGDTVLSNLTVAGGTDVGVFVFSGALTISDSTIIDNDSGGVYAESGAELSLINSTVTNNPFGVRSSSFTVVQNSTIVNNGTGILNQGTVPEIMGSLIASNTATNCNLTIADLGGNVFGDNTCTGTATAGLAGTFSTTLNNNGCSTPCTQTMELFAGSPAIDANTTCVAGLLDQRGVPRTAGACDAGAFELAMCSSNMSASNQAELGFAINCYNGVFSAAMDTAITFTDDILLSEALPSITNTDSTPPALTIDGQGFTLEGEIRQTAGSTTITTLQLISRSEGGTGVDVEDGAMTISNSTIAGYFFGNGIATDSPDLLEVRNSTVTGNGDGIAVGDGANAIALFSTIANNRFRAFVGAGTAQAFGSLLAESSVECSVGTFSDLGGNAIGDESCNGAATTGLLGTFSTTLATNGCIEPCTETLALLVGSPAIDANDGCMAGEVDQRGVARSEEACDAGAFELGDLDADGDGFDGSLGDNTDCDDTNADVNPSAVEVPYNGLDDDCVGGDEVDADGDDSPANAATGGTPDCDDTDPAVNPDATEVPYDGVDDDCVGGDLVDADGDDSPANAATGGTPDCDDTNPAVNPDATEIPGNGIDEDCDGVDAPLSTATCEDQPVTIDMNLNGGDGDGTAGPDVILGTPGDDIINGFGGDDIICADTGDDIINGGDGFDTIIGNPGNDVIDGGDQGDTIDGGGGDDIIDGGNGWDRITGSTGHDTITGGNGNDRIWAGPGVDSLDGGPGNDLLLGFDGNDTIRAGGGQDLMNGMNGDDDVEGGDGFDQIWGGLGNDHLKGNGGIDWIWGRWGEDTIEGGWGNDSLFGEGSADLIYGGPGNDLINGGIGTDDLRGNDGNDTIEGGDQADTMSGGLGNDTFDGGFGNDTCDGNQGIDAAINCENLTNIP